MDNGIKRSRCINAWQIIMSIIFGFYNYSISFVYKIEKVMEHIILETSRLLLREMRVSDMDSLSSILRDDKVMYAYNGAFNEEETEQWMQKQLQRYKDFGFGLWAVLKKDTGGYLIYASIFAAIAASVNEQEDSQQFMLPGHRLVS